MTDEHPQLRVEDAAARTAALRARLVPALDPADAAVTWLVGGVVRDALLDRPLLDVDLATGADPERVARALAREFGGTPFPLGDRPGDEQGGCWRVAAEPLQLDVCALRGGALDTDLAARDFTVNALALPVTGAAPQVVDRAGGVADLGARVLRVVSPGALDDDPLRMLRAARIAHVLGLRIDDATTAAIRARAARAVEPAGERTFAELRLLLLHREARRGWQRLEQLGLDAVLLPELDACRGVEQSRFHHLDVHDHTLAVLDNCDDLLDATDFWLALPPGDDAPRAEPWSDQQRLTVLLAALCHDLAKPPTRRVLDDGRVSFLGHDDQGRAIVDALAARWRWSGTLRQHVRTLVGTHLALGYLLHGDRDARARWRFLRAVEPVAAEAIVLSVGDRLATAGVADRRRWVRAHLQLARELWRDHWTEQRDGRPLPLLDGGEIARIAGIRPGPRVGELVTALAEAQAVGEVTDVDAAERLVRALEASSA